MEAWEGRKRAADRFMPEIKRILGEHLIGEAPVEEDRERNTDLIVLRLDSVRIAVRVRTYQYLARFGGEFTIREGRPSGVLTELAKVVQGWGDYMFYGFADENGEGLAAWRLLDLDIFRLWFSRTLCTLEPKALPGIGRLNGDYSSSFRAFRVADFPPGFIVAEGGSHAAR